MTILKTFRHSGVSYSVTPYSDRTFHATGYKPSGADDGLIIGVGLFCWSGSYVDGCWMPCKREFLGGS